MIPLFSDQGRAQLNRIIPFALAWQGVVDQVVDGDSLKIRHESGRVYNVQLYGVRTPQLSQPSGLEAKEAARKLVEGKAVFTGLSGSNYVMASFST